LELLSYDYLNFSIKDNHILLTNPKFYGVYNKFNHSYQIDKLNNKLNINSKVNNENNNNNYKKKIKIKIPDNIIQFLEENKLHKIISVNIDKYCNAYIVYGYNNNSTSFMG
jgi:hypothetical protein